MMMKGMKKDKVEGKSGPGLKTGLSSVDVRKAASVGSAAKSPSNKRGKI